LRVEGAQECFSYGFKQGILRWARLGEEKETQKPCWGESNLSGGRRPVGHAKKKNAMKKNEETWQGPKRVEGATVKCWGSDVTGEPCMEKKTGGELGEENEKAGP